MYYYRILTENSFNFKNRNLYNLIAVMKYLNYFKVDQKKMNF